jgi:hypothetical protein
MPRTSGDYELSGADARKASQLFNGARNLLGTLWGSPCRRVTPWIRNAFPLHALTYGLRFRCGARSGGPLSSPPVALAGRPGVCHGVARRCGDKCNARETNSEMMKLTTAALVAALALSGENAMAQSAGGAGGGGAAGTAGIGGRRDGRKLWGIQRRSQQFRRKPGRRDRDDAQHDDWDRQ